MKDRKTGFKDKNGREICVNDLLKWETDILLQIKKGAIGAVLKSRGNYVVLLRFQMNDELVEDVRVLDNPEKITIKEFIGC